MVIGALIDRESDNLLNGYDPDSNANAFQFVNKIVGEALHIE
jgi:hypothetical protein